MGVMAVLALLVYGLAAKGEGSLVVGDPAPDAARQELNGGETATLADYRGQWVLVNFWASWCDPCRVESPDLQRFQDEHADDGFTVLGINTEDLSTDAQAFVDEFELT